MTTRYLLKILLTLLASLLMAMPAAARDWQVNASNSKLSFSGSYQKDPFTGVFPDFDATIRFDPAALDQALFDVKIKLGSVDTQSRMRDETLVSSSFFKTDEFPSAHFVTRSFEPGKDGTVLAHGTLTLRGITQPVTLTVRFQQNGDEATLDAHTTVDRLDFKLGADSDWDDISRQITVDAHLELH